MPRLTDSAAQRPVKLVEWLSVQSQRKTAFAVQLRESWIPRVMATIVYTLKGVGKGWFNLQAHPVPHPTSS